MTNERSDSKAKYIQIRVDTLEAEVNEEISFDSLGMDFEYLYYWHTFNLEQGYETGMALGKTDKGYYLIDFLCDSGVDFAEAVEIHGPKQAPAEFMDDCSKGMMALFSPLLKAVNMRNKPTN